MCSLSLFPEPPPSGCVTTCETNGYLSSAPVSSLEFSRYVASLDVPPYKCVSIPGPGDSHSLLSKSPFVPMELDLWRKSVAAWTKQGLTAALVELCENNKKEDLTWINIFARKVTSCIRWTKSLRSAFHPHLMLTDEDMIQEYVSTEDWKSGQVRAFAWHPHLDKFAVAFHDDQVKVFSSTSSSPVLKYFLQKGVTDLGWRPFTASVLAVATCNGIAIWTLDPKSLVTNPSPASCVQMLTKPNHSPVTCIQWSPCGRLLLSCSPRDSSIMLWNVDTGVGMKIRQSGGSGVPFGRWSPDGWRVFSASCSKVFRVWECGSWTSDWWSSGMKQVIAACWSPEGTRLLIAVKDDPIIYSVTFTNPESAEHGDAVGGAKDAIPLINLAPISMGSGKEQISIGGRVQAMVWDKTGTRLAISFASKESPQELIAVFRTKLTPSLIVTPCGFIRGFQDEVPQCMAFRDNAAYGVMLTVCWSSGKLTQVRLLTAEDSGSPSQKSTLMTPTNRLFSLNASS